MIEWNIRIVGALMLGIVCLHFFFPRWFRWGEELPRLGLLNRQIFVVHTIFVVLLLILLALLLLVHSSSLLAAGGLGRAIFFGMAMFWGVRLLVQLCYYDRSLWRGHTGKTLIHIGVTMLCLYFAAVFVWAGLSIPASPTPP